MQEHDTVEGVITQVTYLIEIDVLDRVMPIIIEPEYSLLLPIEECFKQVKTNGWNQRRYQQHDVRREDDSDNGQVEYNLERSNHNEHVSHSSASLSDQVKYYRSKH